MDSAQRSPKQEVKREIAKVGAKRQEGIDKVRKAILFAVVSAVQKKQLLVWWPVLA
jgi:hypothetical protein